MPIDVGTAVAVLQEHDVGRIAAVHVNNVDHDVDLRFASGVHTFPEPDLTVLSTTRVSKGVFPQGGYWITWKAHAKHGGLFYKAYAYEKGLNGARGARVSRIR